MDINKYIASGILELYVAGSLSEKENQEVYEAIQKYPEVKKENIVIVGNKLCELFLTCSKAFIRETFRDIDIHHLFPIESEHVPVE